MKNLALFDFDGTITTKDSLFDFHSFVFGKNLVRKALLRTVPLLLKARLVPARAQEAKEHFLCHFWKNKPRLFLNEWGQRYGEERLPHIIRPRALEAIQNHIAQGDTVCIITASVAEWIQPWSETVGVERILASEMETVNGLLTGRLSGSNCKGPEKVRRIREVFDLSQWDNIVAYGDSSGDREMLDVAQIRYYRWKRLTDRS